MVQCEITAATEAQTRAVIKKSHRSKTLNSVRVQLIDTTTKESRSADCRNSEKKIPKNNGMVWVFDE